MTAEALALIADEDEEQTPLPEGWRVVRLGNICQIKGGKRLPAGTNFSPTETDSPYIRVTDFVNGTIRTTQLKYLHEETQKQIARYIINRDDVYISIAGSIGFVGTIPDELDGANLTENAARLIIDRETVDRDFLSRYLQSSEGQQQIKHRTNFMGQPKLALERIATIEIPLPPTLEEQRRIAAVLDEQMKAVEQARRAVEEQLQAAKLLPSAFLCSVFESAESQNWRTKNFGKLIDNFDGSRIPLSQGERKEKKGIYPYYGASGIIDYLDEYIFDGAFMLIGEDGANLLSRSTPIAFKAEGKFWVNNHAHVVKPKNEVTMDYLIHFFAFIDLSPFVNGMAQPKLSQRELNRIPVLLPSEFEDQKAITQKLNGQMEGVENLKKTLTDQLEAIRKIPSALLRNAFAGEV